MLSASLPPASWSLKMNPKRRDVRPKGSVATEERNFITILFRDLDPSQRVDSLKVTFQLSNLSTNRGGGCGVFVPKNRARSIEGSLGGPLRAPPKYKGKERGKVSVAQA